MSSSQASPVSSYFSLHPTLQKNIVARLGWRNLRPVQELAIPPLLASHDAVILAPTAGGKTESAMFALLSRVAERNPGFGPHIIYLCPLKALINNLLTRLQTLAGLVGQEAFSWHGEVSHNHRRQFLLEPKSVLLTTPESLQVLLSRSNIDPGELFANLLTVVVDEVHAFCGEDRGDQLAALLEQLDGWCKRPIQRVGLSATVGNPQELLAWLSGERGTERSLVDPSADGASRQPKLLEVHPVGRELETVTRVAAALMLETPKSLFFVDSRRQAEAVQAGLVGLGVDALAHHSSLSQEIREKTEEAFRGSQRGSRKPRAIVCTSTLELGLDVGDIDKVFQFGAPATVSAFLQRLGRAGRRQDNMAHMVFLTDQEESFLQALALIHLALQKRVEPVSPHRRSFTVMVQQLLLVVLRNGAVWPSRLWEILGEAHPFSEIAPDEREEVLEHLLHHCWLTIQDGRLMLGPRTEKEHGRSNYMELLSVFSGGSSVKVQSESGRLIGTVDYSAALNLERTGQSFLLGGGSWKVKRWDPFSKTLLVTGSVGGEALRWSGGKSELSASVVRECRHILTGDQSFSFLGKGAQARLTELRQEYSYLDPAAPLWRETRSAAGPRASVEQWAGTAVHRTLACCLSGWLGCDYRADSRSWQLEVPVTRLEELVAGNLSNDWRDFCLAGLKSYRGKYLGAQSPPKFHDLLPPRFQEELLLRENFAVEESEQYWKELATRERR